MADIVASPSFALRMDKNGDILELNGHWNPYLFDIEIRSITPITSSDFEFAAHMREASDSLTAFTIAVSGNSMAYRRDSNSVTGVVENVTLIADTLSENRPEGVMLDISGAEVDVKNATSLPLSKFLNDDDNIVASIHSDLVRSMSGDDAIDGASGNDRLYGGTGDDAVFGSGGNDTLLGEDGQDALSGENESDTLIGGKDADFLDGGAGDDIFAFKKGDTGDTLRTVDIIAEWEAGDQIMWGARGTANNYQEEDLDAGGFKTAVKQVQKDDFEKKVEYVLLYNEGTETGYLFSGVSKDGDFEEAIIIQGLKSATDFGFQDII